LTQHSVTHGLPRPDCRRASPAGIRHDLRLLGRVALITIALVASEASANANEELSPREIRLPAPGSAEWQPLHFRSIERRTDYQVRTDPAGRPAYRAVSDCAASAMRLALSSDLDLEATPRLAWRWRVERGLDHAEEKTKVGDDFAARVYVLYEFDAANAEMMARMQRSLGRRLFGIDLPGKTINYVWASRVPVGESWTSPHHDDAQLLAVATDSSAAGLGSSEWREMVVDLRTDAQTLFEPPVDQRPYAFALMVDADDRCQSAVAWFSDFRLLGPLRSPESSDPQGAHHAGP